VSWEYHNGWHLLRKTGIIKLDFLSFAKSIALCITKPCLSGITFQSCNWAPGTDTAKTIFLGCTSSSRSFCIASHCSHLQLAFELHHNGQQDCSKWCNFIGSVGINEWTTIWNVLGRILDASNASDRNFDWRRTAAKRSLLGRQQISPQGKEEEGWVHYPAKTNVWRN
jgi:hypothetical protein